MLIRDHLQGKVILIRDHVQGKVMPIRDHLSKETMHSKFMCHDSKTKEGTFRLNHQSCFH